MLEIDDQLGPLEFYPPGDLWLGSCKVSIWGKDSKVECIWAGANVKDITPLQRASYSAFLSVQDSFFSQLEAAITAYYTEEAEDIRDRFGESSPMVNINSPAGLRPFISINSISFPKQALDNGTTVDNKQFCSIYLSLEWNLGSGYVGRFIDESLVYFGYD